MKTLNYAVVMLIILILVACSPKEESAKEANKLGDSNSLASENQVIEKEDPESEEVKADSQIEITLPADFFETEEDLDALIEAEKDSGLGEVEKNADGSITYTMNHAEQQEMLDNIRENTTETIKDVINSEEFPSIHDITYQDDLSEFTFVVDKATYESGFDLIGTIGIGMSGIYYQHFNGAEGDANEVVVQIVDESTEEVFDEIVYP